MKQNHFQWQKSASFMENASSLLLHLFTYYQENYPYKSSNFVFFRFHLDRIPIFQFTSLALAREVNTLLHNKAVSSVNTPCILTCLFSLSLTKSSLQFFSLQIH